MHREIFLLMWINNWISQKLNNGNGCDCLFFALFFILFFAFAIGQYNERKRSVRERVDGIGKGLWAETQTRLLTAQWCVLYVYGANKTRYLLEQPLCYATVVCRSLNFESIEPLYTFYNCLCVLVFFVVLNIASNHKEYKWQIDSLPSQIW